MFTKDEKFKDHDKSCISFRVDCTARKCKQYSFFFVSFFGESLFLLALLLVPVQAIRKPQFQRK